MKKKLNRWRPKEASLKQGKDVSSTSRVQLSQNVSETRQLIEEFIKSAKEKDSPTLRDVMRDMARVGKEKISAYADADRVLMIAMSSLIELAASRYALDSGEQWETGKPLKLLLAGYSGTRNTGADVRVEEMIRQFRHLFGDEHVELSIFTLDPELTRGYFRTVRQLKLPKLFPKFLFDTIHAQHAVIACEGSMFKSKFANALSTMMVGAIGLAAAEGKLAVGYGGEAGKMDPSLADLVRRYCQDALIIARNENSKGILSELGVASRSGTDTAWTFEPAPPEVGRAIAMKAGWDGVTPILALCPINPFWWPVKPNVTRAAVHACSDLYAESHYGSVYFHAEGSEVDEKQDRYLDALADATVRFMKHQNVFPMLYGSEQLDRRACEALNQKLIARVGGQGFPVIVSDEHDMYSMVSAMRQATYMISSRYHACVMTMAGGVLSVGVTMDERIENLMADRKTPHFSLHVEDPELAEKLYAVLEEVAENTDEIARGIDECVYANLERMGTMGMILVDYIRQHHPEFPFRSELGEHGDPWEHLPALPEAVSALVKRVRSRKSGSLARRVEARV